MFARSMFTSGGASSSERSAPDSASSSSASQSRFVFSQSSSSSHTNQMSASLPLRSETKPSFEPSGLHTGSASLLGCWLTLTGPVEPSAAWT